MNTSGIFSRTSKSHSKSESNLSFQADYIKKLKERYITSAASKPVSNLVPSAASEVSNTIKSNRQAGATSKTRQSNTKTATLYMDEAGETRIMKKPKFSELDLESKTSMFLQYFQNFGVLNEPELIKTILQRNEGEIEDRSFFGKCLKDYINQLQTIDNMCEAMVDKWYEQETKKDVVDKNRSPSYQRHSPPSKQRLSEMKKQNSAKEIEASNFTRNIVRSQQHSNNPSINKYHQNNPKRVLFQTVNIQNMLDREKGTRTSMDLQDTTFKSPEHNFDSNFQTGRFTNETSSAKPAQNQRSKEIPLKTTKVTSKKPERTPSKDEIDKLAQIQKKYGEKQVNLLFELNRQVQPSKDESSPQLKRLRDSLAQSPVKSPRKNESEAKNALKSANSPRKVADKGHLQKSAKSIEKVNKTANKRDTNITLNNKVGTALKKVASEKRQFDYLLQQRLNKKKEKEALLLSPVKPLEPIETLEKRTSRRESSLRIEIPDDQPQKNLFFKKTDPVTKPSATKQGQASAATTLKPKYKKDRRGKQSRSPQVDPAPVIPTFIHESKPKDEAKEKIDVKVALSKEPYEKLNTEIKSSSPFDVHHESPRASYCFGESTQQVSVEQKIELQPPVAKKMRKGRQQRSQEKLESRGFSSTQKNFGIVSGFKLV